ncbi:MAG: hypothetical protein NTX54_01175 [Chloroflexi bacterium]|nr:hypothetical protein [Chloroflexota bacterium]
MTVPILDPPEMDDGSVHLLVELARSMPECRSAQSRLRERLTASYLALPWRHITVESGSANSYRVTIGHADVRRPETADERELLQAIEDLLETDMEKDPHAYGVDQERDATVARDAIVADRAIRVARWHEAGITARKSFRYVFRYAGVPAILWAALLGFGAGMFVGHGDPLRGVAMAAIFVVVFGLPVALAFSSFAWLVARFP